MSFIGLLVVFVLFSLGGYMLEYVNECATSDVCQPRTSVWFSSFPVKVPLIPIYGFAGVGMWLLTPWVFRTFPTLAQRFVFLVLVLSALELAVGWGLWYTRGIEGWNYGPPLYYVDLKHSLAWGVLATVVIEVMGRYANG